MRLLFRCCLFLLLSATGFSSVARNGNDPFFLQHYDNRSGLSNSSINYIFKDASNLLWVATWDGLNMYDGNNFHVFNYNKDNDFKSIGSNVIQQVTEDKRGNIWITTIEGISRYEKFSGRFYNYFYDQYQRSRVSEQEYALTTDTSGNVYCFNQKNGLSVYDFATDTFRNFHIAKQGKGVTKMLFDNLNCLWILSNDGQLGVFRKKANGFELLSGQFSGNGVANFFKVGEQLFYTTTDDRLFRINRNTRGSDQLMQLPHAIGAMTFYKGHYLFAWMGKGYGVYNASFQKDDFLQQESLQHQDIKVTSFSLGTEDILWYGTDGNGIIKVYPKTKSFGTISTSDNGMPYNRSVRAFCEANGDLWLGTKGSGILSIKDFWQGNSPHSRSYLSAPGLLDNNSVYSLTRSKDELIYIGSDAKGIGVYDVRGKRFYKWGDIKGAGAYAEFGSVYAIREDADQSLWLGTSGYGLIHLKINREAGGVLSIGFLEKFIFDNSNKGPANDIIYALADGDKDHLWIGCRYGGLSLLDKKTKLFTSFKAFTYDGSLSNNDVLSLFKDNRNRLWIGTSYGLNWLEESEAAKPAPIFQKLTTTDGLPNNTIHAIEQDSAGHLWVSTNKGLAKVTPDGKVFYYQQGDGLQSNEFCDGAVWKDKSGMLFFGGTYGFNHFLPQNILRSSWQPNLLLSNISIGGKNIAGDGYNVLDSTARPLSFTINRKDNFFELDIKAVSFLNAEKCEYAYFLEGYDKIWHYSGTTGKIVYNNLLPGTYSLRVKWSNGEGAWSGETKLISIEVQQYFWLRWYALLFYALVIGAVIYILYSYRKNKNSIRRQLEVEHLLREKDEAMHESRIGFFTNIAHELQTPLTLIMGSAERFMDPNRVAREKDKPYFLSMIHQQASRLTYLVHQLLEFRKGEAGFFKNQYAYLNVSELLQNLAEPFIAVSEKKGLDYEISIPAGISGWTDKDKLEKIIFNLLSNAFKHSDNIGQVIFSVAEQPQEKQLEITVINSGADLSPEVLEHLFDQFYVARPGAAGTEQFGTGIGLAFTRQLVSLLNGEISASSENGHITFKVLLPLNTASSRLPANEESNEQPSYLYKSITSAPEPVAIASATENNKYAIIENLHGEDKRTILIVEDDANIRFLLKDIFKEEYIIYEAMDGGKALEMLEKFIPDLLICDVMMPNMNGLELCNRIKNAPATCQVPVIMLSARDSQDQHMEGYEVGADAYISKPFHTEHLRLRVRTMLEYRQKMLQVTKNTTRLSDIENADLPDGDKSFLVGLVKFINEHIADVELNAVFLEKEFNMSKMQLYRKLKTMTEMTPGEFIRHVRLKQAAELLATTNLNVTEIFYRTGFNNQSYFFREFKKRFGCAPNEYRANKTVI
ncbi:hybrid sensor histidine kinase/response regulator transcription factor [Ferruginibacter sp. HRS2-29]|uniref:hybrid sensor histidine kinase/response regulator transcription factor n=1 Tax=Ferruginibacter sp. HRS2-29 TaxID=2487334 RepID=UPI0020CED936|nr:hybrid sensor histidine kinase/response regulator transcription factor [Ferruginibacter sp. HRS2-29]